MANILVKSAGPAEKKSGLTYKKSGVNVAKAEDFIKAIKPFVKLTARPEVMKDIGGFGALFGFKARNYNSPVLVSSTDGVGTKLKLAFLVNKHDTIGIDAVAMNVNDILCTGAEPLFFLDYIACNSLNKDVMSKIVKGIAKGCVESGCALIGGETAQMPGIYKEGEYDIAGFSVGVVERDKIIDGSAISLNDKIIGLASSGLHSNGFSLARKVFAPSKIRQDERLKEWLLEPTRIYVKPVLKLIEEVEVKGIAHITGGAFYSKLPRIIPKDFAARIYKNSWPIPDIFKLIQNKGDVDEREMYSTFNMGVGMAVVVRPRDVDKTQEMLMRAGVKNWVIGEIVKMKESREKIVI